MSSSRDLIDALESEKPPVILICDDDLDILKIIGHTVTASGYVAVEADSGERAMEICKEQLPDLILMDIMMPGISGIDFVTWLRSEVKDRFIPVLFLTALTELEHRVIGLDAGADDYLTKPFKARELLARVDALLRTKKLTERLHQQNTKLKELNEQLVDAQEALVQKERELVALQLAGAAAHKLLQPVTTILLHCHMIEQGLGVQGDVGEDMSKSVLAIRKECNLMNATLRNLTNVDVNQTEDYVAGVKIMDLEIPDDSEGSLTNTRGNPGGDKSE